MYLFVALFLGSGSCKLLETLHRENFYFCIYEMNFVIDEKCRDRSGCKSWSLSLSDKINFRYVLSRNSDKSDFFELVFNRVDLVVKSTTNYLPLSTWTTNFLGITFSLCQTFGHLRISQPIHWMRNSELLHRWYTITINRLKSDCIMTK